MSLRHLMFALVIGCWMCHVASALVIRSSPVINMCKKPGHFAMTFDQGPSIHTGAVLDALASRKVKATFHPVVSFLKEVAVVSNLMRAKEEGHCIGLSIESNVDLGSMTMDDMLTTIDSRAQYLADCIGVKPVFLRIPSWANMTAEQLGAIIKKGYVITTYNLDSYDYSTDNVLESFQTVLDVLSPSTKGCFISVQRDYIRSSAEQTSIIIDYIISKGYTLVDLAECIGLSSSKSGNHGGGTSKGPRSGVSAETSAAFMTTCVSAVAACVALTMTALSYLL